MRAVVLDRRPGFGADAAGVPVVRDIPAPLAPTATDVLVRVAASSLNGTDRHVARGAVPALPFSGAARLGFDLAGEVIACGPRVTSVGVGDRVVALLGHAGGGQAEQVVVAARAVAPAPASVPLEHAAALPLAGLTALQALYGRAALGARRRPRVLVLGAAGGIGAFAVQLARLAGAHVTAAASGDRGDFLRELGADEVVDPRRDDALGVAHWDVVLDTPGALSMARVRPRLRGDGALVSTRPISVDAARSLASGVLRRGGPRFVAVMTRRSGADLARLSRMVDAGALRIPIDRVFALEQIAGAHARLGSGDVRGKVVVTL